MSRRGAARLLTGLGALGLLGGLGTTVARSLPGVPGVTEGTWVMATTFTDAGVLGYGVALAAFGAATFLRRSRLRVAAGLLTLALAAVHVSWMVPRWVPDHDTVAGPGRVRVLSQNAELGQADAAGLVAAAGQADVLVVVELTSPLAERLRAAGLDRLMPHASGGELPWSGSTGTRIYSRYPLTAAAPLTEGYGDRNWRADVEVPGFGPLTVAAVHPQRPVRGWTGWTAEQEAIRQAAPTVRTVVAGDFNAVASHPSLRRFDAAGFRDSAAVLGVGWPRTWPATGPVPPLITIDHVLLSPDLTATGYALVHPAGTDHRGVLATVAVRG